jgi:hypothetical protein
MQLPMPVYTSNCVTAHNKALLWTGSVECRGHTFETSSTYTSKREAEQEAAKLACKQFGLRLGLDGLTKVMFDCDVNETRVKALISPSSFPSPPHVQKARRLPSDFSLFHRQPSKSASSSAKSSPASADETKRYSPDQSISKHLVVISDQAQHIPKHVIILIDLENIQPSILAIPKNTTIYGFMSAFSTIAKNELIQTFVVDSPVAEAADHCMTYITAKLVASGEIHPDNNKIVIVSRDKSSAILVHMLKSDKFEVTHLKTTIDIEAYIKKLDQ